MRECRREKRRTRTGGERLCADDAIQQALADGRLADAFLFVRSVLLTYNPHSPYVSLDAWNGPDCDDCGSSVSDDEAGGCDNCGCVLYAECQWHGSERLNGADRRKAQTPAWNNGPVEGAINRLKSIKRQMFGRAGFDLLRTRVQLAG